MRLAFLTLLLGILVGFAARSFIGEHPQWYLAFSPAQTPAPEPIRPSSTEPKKPRSYPSPEKTLARLKDQFDEAVVVVLAEQSYDDQHKLVRVSVLEVWKGPADLAGKTMDSHLKAPNSYLHGSIKERVLKFMPMTPHLDTSGTVYFDGDVLRMNPTFTSGSLKQVLITGQKEERG